MPRLYGRELDWAELRRRVGRFDQLFGVDLIEHGDGQERGSRVLRFRTGSGFAFEVLLDRAMDLKGVEIHGVPIGWHSPVGFRHPWLHEHDAEEGLGWLRSFSGLMNTCGLDHIMGPAEEDAAHYRYPYRRRIRHGLHGRIAYTPARLVAYGLRWAGERAFLYAEGEVRQATMFGENLTLQRTIEAEVGGETMTVRDTVTNEGFHPTPHAILYHVNVGYPVIDDHARLLAPIEATPATVHDPSATSIGPIEQAPPQHRFVEQVYEHRLRAGVDGMVPVALVNPDFRGPGWRGLGLLMAYDGQALPAFYEWQNLQEGHYVVGIEPATAHAGSREEKKARGEIVFLEHGESRGYTLQLTALAGEAALAAAEERVSQVSV